MPAQKRKVRKARMWAAAPFNPRDACWLVPWKDYARHYAPGTKVKRVTVIWEEQPKKRRTP